MPRSGDRLFRYWLKPRISRIAVFTMTNEGPLIMIQSGKEMVVYRAATQWNKK